MSAAVEQLARALADRAHLDPALLATDRLAPLVLDRRSALRLSCDDDYAARALADQAEFERLRDLVAVPETWLFRYLPSFEVLRDWLAERRAVEFRGLSVPCATGAEPLSMAAAALAAGVPAAGIRVDAVDPSTDALQHARTGRFSRMGAREGVPAWAQEWFHQAEGGLCALPDLLDRIAWHQDALPDGLGHLEAGSFDAVFCRNLAIYLGPKARRAAGNLLLQLVKPGGLVFLGHAEPPSIFGLSDELHSFGARGAFAFALQRPRDARAELEADQAPTPRSLVAAAVRTERPASRTAPASPPRATSASAPIAPPVASLAEIESAANAGRTDRALEWGRARLTAGDQSPELRLVLGSAHAARGELAQAEEMFRQALYMKPDSMEALLQLATLAARRGDDSMAERYRLRAAQAPGGAGDST
jgi:chemotaxis protein methyltransferase WspC